MKYLQEIGTITNKTEIAQGIYDVILYCPKIADIALPGQFINILCSCYTLRRPISICGIDKEDGCIRIVFEIRGQGTDCLATLDIGCLLYTSQTVMIIIKNIEIISPGFMENINSDIIIDNDKILEDVYKRQISC